VEKQERQFWIDALCINQEDVSERNHQVRMIGKIYSQAQGIVAWLGRARNNSDPVMRHLNSIGVIRDAACVITP
jgi:Heterokaryon incompatibility protein (HET)